jgi:hypothetical protein
MLSEYHKTTFASRSVRTSCRTWLQGLRAQLPPRPPLSQTRRALPWRQLFRFRFPPPSSIPLALYVFVSTCPSGGKECRGCSRNENVARYCNSLSSFSLVVTTTMRLTKAHLKRTCAGVPPMRCAILSITGSTGPPGARVNGLDRSPSESV